MISETGAFEPFVDLLRPSGFLDVVNSRPAWGIPLPIILAIPVCRKTGAYSHAGRLDLEFIRTDGRGVHMPLETRQLVTG